MAIRTEQLDTARVAVQTDRGNLRSVAVVIAVVLFMCYLMSSLQLVTKNDLKFFIAAILYYILLRDVLLWSIFI